MALPLRRVELRVVERGPAPETVSYAAKSREPTQRRRLLNAS